jgi:hypothetical protein
LVGAFGLGLVVDSDSANRLARARVAAATAAALMVVAEVPATLVAALGLAGLVDADVQVADQPPTILPPALIDVPDPPALVASHPRGILGGELNRAATVALSRVERTFEGRVLPLPDRLEASASATPRLIGVHLNSPLGSYCCSQSFGLYEPPSSMMTTGPVWGSAAGRPLHWQA